jgi:hypothetical protein
VPSLEDVILVHDCVPLAGFISSVQVAPESVEVQTSPIVVEGPGPASTAASLVPSSEEVMLFHSCVLPTYLPMPVLSIQVSPESVDVQMFAFSTTAASLVPSLDEAMLVQLSIIATSIRIC